ncbi:uncharacterized protein BDZ99DRAFT_255638 [Mytilinidion resinicola]|uniref:F-box domain-containing protein n=1 Tax=Mytilinidion resinicola TaxID=574789 RepID=A0A6A6YZM8_9PEZI|nr:uncharacterized protein BDZ99DRAFT_255638 [Mytilinidion resinicola]KAF2813417.1 hypothetical protein BDZ99DRAFT_255638 [Mytilinidion resinicola]
MPHPRKRSKKLYDVPDESSIAVQPSSSRLMQLPGELRNQIYDHLFSSTTLTIHKRLWGEQKEGLAILRTCSQINREAAPLWPGLALFDFPIRRLRMPGYDLMLKPVHYVDGAYERNENAVYYKPAMVLKLLPGLRLDVLTMRTTVDQSSDGASAYAALSGLIENGNGWKELHYIASYSDMLGFKTCQLWDQDMYRRKPQPSNWSSILSERDGADSKPTVTIYRSTQPDTPGSVTELATHELFEQEIPLEEDYPRFGLQADNALLADKKEMLVIVKRGKGVDIMERSEPPFGLDDIREWAQGMTWAEINYHSLGRGELDALNE